jgi:hypothetical protein
MQITPKQALRLIPACIKARLVPMLAGSPGIGKSNIAHQIALQYNLKVIDLRLSQCDPTDLLGFPTIIGKKAGYLPMETFPIEGDPIPEGYSGWLLFLDEFTSASPSVQAAAYKLVLDRMVGVHNMHKNVAIVCAGNLETDGAIVQEMSTALQSRLVHFELIVSAVEWVEWAQNFGITHHITDYISFKPSAIYTFKADHTDKTYGCPRTLEFANRIMKDTPISDPDLLPLLAGTLSEGYARELITFIKIYDSLPKIVDIQNSPSTAKVPDEPSILYALSGALSHNLKTNTADQLMKYVTRLPVEFQVVTLRDCVRRNKEMLSHGAIQKWIGESSAKLY